MPNIFMITKEQFIENYIWEREEAIWDGYSANEVLGILEDSGVLQMYADTLCKELDDIEYSDILDDDLLAVREAVCEREFQYDYGDDWENQLRAEAEEEWNYLPHR